MSQSTPHTSAQKVSDTISNRDRMDFAPDHRTPVVLACLFFLILGIVFGYFSLFHGWGSHMRDPLKRFLMPFIPWLLIGAGAWGLWLVRDPTPVLTIWPGRGLGGRFLQRRIAFRDIERMELRERTVHSTKVVWLELELAEDAPWPGKWRWWHFWFRPEKVQLALNLLKPASRTAAAEAAIEQWTAWRLQQSAHNARHVADTATQGDVLRQEVDAHMAHDLGMTLSQYQQWMRGLSAPAAQDASSQSGVANALSTPDAPGTSSIAGADIPTLSANHMSDMGTHPNLTPTTPWVVYAFITLNVLVWLWMVWRGVPALSPKISDLYPWGANNTWAVRGLGEYWRLLAATVLHGGFIHLALNMLALYSAGRLCNMLFGHGRFALIYLISALAGSALGLHFSASTSISVGASGAVMGVMGALLASVLRQQYIRTRLGRQALSSTPMQLSEQAKEMAAPLVYTLIAGFVVPHIDNAAHIGGMLAGFAMGWGMYPYSPTQKRKQIYTPNNLSPAPGEVVRTSRGAAISVALCALITGVLVITANPATSMRTAALLQWQQTIGPLFTHTLQTQRDIEELMQPVWQARQSGQPLSPAQHERITQRGQHSLQAIERTLMTAQTLPHTAVVQPDAGSQHVVQLLRQQRVVLQHLADLPPHADAAALADLVQHYQHLAPIWKKIQADIQ